MQFLYLVLTLEVSLCVCSTFDIRSNLTRQYRAKAEQLELARIQAKSINRDYESRLRRKEVVQRYA